MTDSDIPAQIVQAEYELLSALRQGELERGVALHLDSPDYRNIWNGEMKTFDQLSARITLARQKGLAAIDYQVNSREILVLNDTTALATLVATETTHLSTGESKTSGQTIISILWRKIAGQWRLGYLHASEEPQETANPVWQAQAERPAQQL